MKSLSPPIAIMSGAILPQQRNINKSQPRNYTELLMKGSIYGIHYISNEPKREKNEIKPTNKASYVFNQQKKVKYEKKSDILKPLLPSLEKSGFRKSRCHVA